MVLAGFVIALGAIVDDAIVDVENIVRRLRQHRRAGEHQVDCSDHPRRSIEVRGAVVYASFIEVVALAADLLPEQPDGLVLQAARGHLRAGRAASRCWSRSSARPRSASSCSRAVGSSAHESPVAGWLQARLHDGSCRPIIRRPRPGLRRVGAGWSLTGLVIVPSPRRGAVPDVQGAGLPHALDVQAGDVAGRGAADGDPGQPGAAADPGVRNFGSHIGQALLGEEIAGVDFGENWISVDPEASTTTRRWPKIEETVAGFPGHVHQRGDLPRGADQRGDHRRERADRRAHLRPGPRRPSSEGERGEGGDGAGQRRRPTSTSSFRCSCPRSRSTSTWPRPRRYGIKPGDVRRAAATFSPARRWATSSVTGKTYDVQVWSVPESRQSVGDVRDLLIDTPSGATSGSATSPRSRVRPTPNNIQHEDASRRIDIGANVRGPRPGLGGARPRRPDSARSTSRSSTTPSCIGEYKERQAAQNRLLWFAAASLWSASSSSAHAVFKNWRDVVAAPAHACRSRSSGA